MAGEDMVDPPQNGVAKIKENGSESPPPALPPQEEPPKIEEIITDEVVATIVKGYKPDLKVLSTHAELGSKIGDNYMSIMYAVDIEVENTKSKERETLKVMVKTLPRNAFRAEMINEMKAFKKESDIYQKVFPVLTQMQDQKEIPRSLQFGSWPKCYAAYVDGTTDYLAMENLRVDGFKMGNRQLGLDFNHCSLVLRQLARFHAISYAKFGGKRELIVEAFPVLSCGMFDKTSKNAEMNQSFFAQSFKSQADSLKEAGEELAASRMHKLAGIDFVSTLGDLLEKNVDVAVVTHGDCWLNNMLFRYEDKDDKCNIPVQVKFLDFQISSASSRMIDVFYFLMTSAKMDVLEKNERDLLMIYYGEFTSFSQTLGVDTAARGLTWEALLKEAARYRFHGVCLGLLLAPMLMAEASNIPDMDSFTEADFTNNSEDTVKQFYKDITQSTAIAKAKIIVMDHLPKCTGVEQYL